MTYERQLWIWSALICVLFIGMYFVKEILPPFIVGIGVAYFLDPILDKLERLGLSRTLAIVILIAGFFISAVALIILIAPLLQGQVIGFFQKLPAMTDSLVSWLDALSTKITRKYLWRTIRRNSKSSRFFYWICNQMGSCSCSKPI